jgi:hypothetical protein
MSRIDPGKDGRLKVIFTVTVLAVGGLIAGCGSSSNASQTATRSTTASAAAGGAPNAPRPPGTGGGPPPGSGRSGGFANNPKLRAAFQACGARFGFGRGQRFPLSRAAITKYVTCVRQHGYSLPNPNLSGKGPVFPGNIRTNAKFQAASRSCQSLLAPPRPTGTTSGA